jgi:hypothetical protein
MVGAPRAGQETGLACGEFFGSQVGDFLLRREWSRSSEGEMVKTFDSDFDEDAALDSLWESLAGPPPRDIMKRDDERELKGYPRNVALEKWGPEIEEIVLRELQARKSRKPRGQVLPMVKPKEDQPE